MWGGKKVRDKYNDLYDSYDVPSSYDDDYGKPSSGGSHYLESDIRHMCYGFRASACDLDASVSQVSVNGRDKDSDGYYTSFNISITVHVSLGRLSNGNVTSDNVRYVVQRLVDDLGSKLNSKGDFGYNISVSSIDY